jgi:hypothetical protein
VRVQALPGGGGGEAFAPARLDGFSFDVEALFIARRRGFRIAEVPVTWRNDEATRVGTLQGRRRLRGSGADPGGTTGAAPTTGSGHGPGDSRL